MSYMVNPTRVFLQFLSTTHEATTRDLTWYSFGQASMALHIITVIKTLESLPVVTEHARQETISALQTILTDLDMADESYELYERLGNWRMPTFDREPSPPGTSDAGVHADWIQVPRSPGPSSLDASSRGRAAPSARLLEERRERRSPDGSSTSESEG